LDFLHKFLDAISKLHDREHVDRLFQHFLQRDTILRNWFNHHSFDNYEPYCLEDGNTFYIERDSRDLIKGYIKAGSCWEEHICEQFKIYVKPGSTVIDVGGHIGVHTMSLSRLVGDQGKVHVFEPQCKLFVELMMNTYLNNRFNVEFHRLALGERQHVTAMNAIDVENEGNTSIGSGGDEVAVVKLDDFHLTGVSLIKIDVEGYEENVINGSLDTIAKNKPVLIIEIWNNVNLHRKIKKIERLGYQPYFLGNSYDYLFIPIST
jgi:FkbM family methyltransferase